MDRTTRQRLTEYAMLFAAVLTGGVATMFTPPEQRSGTIVPAEEASIHHASAEIPAFDTLGFEVDVRRLNEIAATC